MGLQILMLVCVAAAFSACSDPRPSPSNGGEHHEMEDRAADAQRNARTDTPGAAAPFDIASTIRRVERSFRREDSAWRATGDTFEVRQTGAEWSFSPFHIPRPDAVDGDTPVPTTAEGTTVTFETTAVRRGKSRFELAPGVRRDSEGQLVLQRPTFAERLRNRGESIEQTWRFEARPAGDGPLEVRVRVDGQPFARKTESGLHFRDPDSPVGVRYGHATWIDAEGRETAIAARWDGRDIVLSVPAGVVQKASYPAVLDPIVSAETAIDVPAEGHPWEESDPAVASDGTNFLVVWQRFVAGTRWEIWGTRVSTSGVVLDPGGELYSRSPSHAQHPAVAYNGSQFLVVWEDDRNVGTGTDRDIYGTRVSASQGSRLDGDNIPVVEATASQFQPSVASNGQDFLVVWTDSRNLSTSSHDVYSSMVDTDGNVAGGQRVSNAAGIQQRPAVAHDGTNYLVVWEDHRDAVTNRSDIYGSRVSNAGAPLDPAGVELASGPDDQRFPAVAATGRFLVVWSATDATETYVRGVTYDATDGLGNEFAVSANPGRVPSVASANSEFLAVWETNADVRGTRLAPDGAKIGPELTIAGGSAAQTRPVVAGTNAGWLVSWLDPQTTTAGDVFGAFVEVDGTVKSPDGFLISDDGASSEDPAVAFNGSQFLVAWPYRSGFGRELLAARIAADGTLLDPAGFVLAQGFTNDVTVGSLNGDYLVAYSSFGSSTLNDISGIRVDSSGTASAPFPIANGPGREGDTDLGAVDGNYLVTWSDSGDVHGATIEPATLSVSPFPIADGPDLQRHARVSTSPDSPSAAITWGVRSSDGSTAIRAAAIDVTGTLSPSGGRLVSDAGQQQDNPDVAGFSATHAFVVWRSYRLGAWKVYGQQLRNDATLEGDEIAVSSGPGSMGQVRIAAGYGRYLVAWHQFFGDELRGATWSGSSDELLEEFSIASNSDHIDIGDLVAVDDTDFLAAYRAWEGAPEVRVRTVSTNLPPDVPGDGFIQEDAPEDYELLLYLHSPDPDGDVVSYTVTTPPGHGTLQQDAAYPSDWTYVPDPDYFGQDSAVFTVSDGTHDRDIFVSIDVMSVNDAPEAVDDTVELDEDTTGSVNVLANDSDVDGDFLTGTVVVPPTHGTATISGGTLSYTPDANYHGPDELQYEVSDGQGGTATGKVSIAVHPVADTPQAEDDSATGPEDTDFYVDVLANDVDPDGDVLSTSLVTGPSDGTVLEVANGHFRYTPRKDFNGTDQFTYSVTDGQNTDTAVVALEVTPVNDPPVILEAPFAIVEDSSATFDAVANSFDPDGDPLTATVAAAPNNGTASITGGVLTYTPDPDFNGKDTVDVRVSDGNGGSAIASLTFTVIAINDAPQAADDAASTDEEAAAYIDVLANDSDVDDDPLTTELAAAPTHGSAVEVSNGVFRYTPDDDFAGIDQFTYSVTDGALDATATVTVTVMPLNDAPVLDSAGTHGVTEGDTLSIQLTATDVDGDALSYAMSPILPGAALDGNGNFTWTPSFTDEGVHVVEFTVSDGQATASSEAQITVEFIDNDSDGLPDAWETQEGLDPSTEDSDGDTIADLEEVGEWRSGALDTDGDGTVDALDTDSDDDTVTDADEAGDADLSTAAVDTEGDGTPDFRDVDSDGDTVSDDIDNCRTDSNSPQTDVDRDGIGDVCDDSIGARPDNSDTPGGGTGGGGPGGPGDGPGGGGGRTGGTPDPCADATCDADATCIATGATTYTCACDDGYVGDGFTCEPIDRCANGTDTCGDNSTCVYSGPGAFVCTCNAGYESDGQSCVPIDHCANGTDTCDANATCSFTGPDTYDCTCDENYVGDGVTCAAVDHCTDGTDNCDDAASCSYIGPGSYDCSCDSGYDGDGVYCAPIDHCADGTNSCDANATCTFTGPDTYDCTCEDGYSGDGTSCASINHCADGTDNCDPDATCTSTGPGSFECECPEGFVGDGVTCDAIDPCADGTDNCAANATCTTTGPDTFECACDAGYEGDGVLCVEVDHCAQGTDTCDANAECTFTGPGTYDCDCVGGYSGDGFTCSPIDRCAEGSDDCFDPGLAGVWTSVTTGSGPHSFGITEDGELWGWGLLTGTETPQQLASGAAWRDIDVGQGHACGTRDDGSLWCWGGNYWGQLGLGHTSTDLTPQQVGTDTDWAAVVVGTYHSCALKTDQSLWCWGRNDTGNLGLGDSNHRSTPQQVGTATDWVQISAGLGQTCGTREDTSLWCWGYNANGQLGLGDTTHRYTPEQVWTTLADRVSAGAYHTCAIRDDGLETLWCWGDNSHGQLGTGDTDPRLTPTSLSTSWKTVDLGTHHTCGVRSDDTLWCWGRNHKGQLGLGDTNGRLSRAQVGPESWSAVDLGIAQTCGVQTDGTLWCWGDNRNGMLGLGDTNARSAPEQVALPYTGPETCSYTGPGTYTCECPAGYVGDGVNCVPIDHCADETDDCSDDATCTFTGPGTFDCACDDGYSGDGQSCAPVDHCADGTDTCDANATCTYTGPGTYDCTCSTGYEGDGVAQPPSTWASVSRSDYFPSCGIADDDSLWCWGGNEYGQLGLGDTDDRLSPTRVGTDTWAAVSNSQGHTCGIRTDGTLWCWGRNSNGRLGLGISTRETRTTPQQVGSDSDWIEVAALRSHTCALKNDGALWCWGANSQGDVGVGTTTSMYTTPQRVGTDTDWARISQGHGDHTCATKDDGTLWCWGRNNRGQVGVGDTDPRLVPSQVGAGANWSQVDVGSDHTCGVRDDGTLWCWGWNQASRLGLSSTADQFETPQQVGTSTSWTTASPGSGHTCGLQNDGTLWCWGSNQYGQLGLGDAAVYVAQSPLQIGTAEDWDSLSAGGHGTCGVRDDDTAWCWGWNFRGQLGLGDTTDRNAPAIVNRPPPNRAGCVAVDQCTEGTDDCSTVATCTFTGPGTYDCSCDSGYTGDGVTCAPVDHCFDGTDLCDPNAACTYTGPDTYDCACDAGYSGDGFTCDPIDHCADGTDTCDANADCTFTGPATYDCSCQSGYAGDGTTCTAIDHCADGTDNCDANATCTYTGPGTFDCACYDGYLGDGTTCDPIDHCADGTDNCVGDATCEYTGPGTFDCACPAGLRLDSSGTDCVRDVNAIAAGRNHSCAIWDGELFCWGENSRGQLGNGTVSTNPERTPQSIGLGWDAVALGWGHSCGLKGDDLYCWGSNGYGELGLGTIGGDYPTPQLVGSGWDAVALNEVATCGLKGDELYCWGYNGYYQLGISTVGGKHSTPQLVGSGWTSVDVGRNHTCGTSADELYCWGYNTHEQLGTGTAGEFLPALVGADYDSVATGFWHTCGLKGDELLCWGTNGAGELGLGYTSTSVELPTSVGTGWDAVSAGGHTCGLKGDELHCWGWNGYGQLGIGQSTGSFDTPQSVGTGWSSVAVGSTHTCAMGDDGLRCWGSDGRGQLGQGGSLGDQDTPRPVALPTPEPTRLAVAPQSHDFGTALIGTASTSATIDFFNAGYESSDVLTTTVGGPDASSFTVLSDGCAGTILAGRSSCEVVVAFEPIAAGELTATVTVGNAADGTVAVDLAGEGFCEPGFAFDGSTCVAIDHCADGTDNCDANATCIYDGPGEFHCECDSGYSGDGVTCEPIDHCEDQTDNCYTDAYDGRWAVSSVGPEHSCGISIDGKLWCWGENGVGRLGLGDTVDRDAPTQVGGDSDWSDVSAGWAHACATRTDGTLWCWGQDYPYTPTQVGGDTDWALVQSGWGFSCALKTDDTLWCWGRNNWGQLGVGDTSARTAPEQVGTQTWSGLGHVSGEHFCAVRTDGTLWCWGRNDYGQLGLGDSTRRTSPTQVGVDTDWARTTGGALHSCATKTDGTLHCFGRNAFGELGLGDQNARSTPTEVGTGVNWSNLAAGQLHTCATTTSGEVWCWGHNGYGQLGLGDSSNRLTPQQVGTDTDWATLSGGWHTCALRTDSTHWCWGFNRSGQLGLGDDTNRRTPTQVPLPRSEEICTYEGPDAYSCSCPDGYSGDGTSCTPIDHCADGTDACDDAAACAYTGPGSYDCTCPSGTIDALGNGSDCRLEVSTIEAGRSHTCALSATELFCWGRNDHGQLGIGTIDTESHPMPRSLGTGWEAISLGTDTSCGLKGTDLYCWGRNHWGQLGVGDTLERDVPTFVSSGWSAVATAGAFTCGINSNKLYCWGFNGGGALGIGTTDLSVHSVPELVGTGWSVVGVGGGHTCGIVNDALYCWGPNNSGQLGIGNDFSTHPSPEFVGNGWDDVEIGGLSSCGLRGDTLLCWGDNSAGQLGLGVVGGTEPSPAVVGRGWTDITVDNYHSCGLRTSDLYCWGSNTNGQLGIGHEGPALATPTFVGAGWESVSNGIRHTCAVGAEGAHCWGANGWGELGIGSIGTPESAPTPVQLPLP